MIKDILLLLSMLFTLGNCANNANGQSENGLFEQEGGTLIETALTGKDEAEKKLQYEIIEKRLRHFTDNNYSLVRKGDQIEARIPRSKYAANIRQLFLNKGAFRLSRVMWASEWKKKYLPSIDTFLQAEKNMKFNDLFPKDMMAVPMSWIGAMLSTEDEKVKEILDFLDAKAMLPAQQDFYIWRPRYKFGSENWGYVYAVKRDTHEVVMHAEDIESVDLKYKRDRVSGLNIQLKPALHRKFQILTARCMDHDMAVTLDGELIGIQIILSLVKDGKVNFMVDNKREANSLVTLLHTPPLEQPLENLKVTFLGKEGDRLVAVPQRLIDEYNEAQKIAIAALPVELLKLQKDTKVSEYSETKQSMNLLINMSNMDAGEFQTVYKIPWSKLPLFLKQVKRLGN
ncbi:MAG: hypothetical protein AAF573_03885 [Bacteroidota bacterium]